MQEHHEHSAAKTCWERVAEGHTAQRDHFSAATALERAGSAASAASDWSAVEECSTKAANLYLKAGRPDSAAKAVSAAAEALEPVSPTAASQLHLRAMECLNDSSSNSDSPISKKLALVRQASGTLKRCVTRSMCRAYLASIVLWLYAGDATAAWGEYQDALKNSGDEFKESEEGKAAAALFEACRSGDITVVENAIAKFPCFQRLEGGISPLAAKLGSQDDVKRLSVQLATCEQS